MLGLLVGATIALILGLLAMSAAIVIAGIALVAVAEWLIWSRRLFNAGIEEGLWTCGLGLVALDQSGILHGSNERTLEWLLAGALAIAGVRLLNALLTTAAALLASVALYSAIGIRWPPVLPDWAPPSFVVSLLCYLGALAALAAGARRYRRPAHDRMLDGLVCTLPVAGYLWVGHSGWYASGIDYRHVHSLPSCSCPPRRSSWRSWHSRRDCAVARMRRCSPRWPAWPASRSNCVRRAGRPGDPTRRRGLRAAGRLLRVEPLAAQPAQRHRRAAPGE